jgi:phage terminase large subunit
VALVLRRKQSDEFIDYNWLHTPVLTRTREAVATTVVSVGGARSSKSYSLGQLFCQKLAEEEHKVLGISRKTFPSLRMSNLRLMLKLLGETGMLRRGQYNKTEHSFEYRSNILYFFSLDDPEKIKSTEFNYLWLEEANEFTYEDYIVAKLRLSGPTRAGEKNHIYLSLNPIDESNWVPQRLREQEDVEWLHSTYRDNPFLEEEYKRILEDLVVEIINLIIFRSNLACRVSATTDKGIQAAF